MRDEEIQAQIEDFIEGFNLDALDRVILFENGRTPITRAIRVHAALCGARTATFCYALAWKSSSPRSRVTGVDGRGTGGALGTLPPV
jgi:hypothetical protein